MLEKILLSHRLTGFRHDTDLQLDDHEPFQVLGKPVEQRAAWWKFWGKES